jgi:hypothetical protein
VANAQHHTHLVDLIRGDWPLAGPEGGRAAFGWAAFCKCMLDAGLAPGIGGRILEPAPEALRRAVHGLASRALRVEPVRAGRDLATRHWLFEGRSLGWDAPARAQPVSFISCVHDEAQWRANLAASPCFRAGAGHQLIGIRGAASIGEGFRAGLAQAACPWVVLVHQDVYLPPGWPERFQEQWLQAERRFGRIGVAGVLGTWLDPRSPDGRTHAGRILDRQSLIQETPGLPCPVDTLDEVLLGFRREGTLRPDPALGFHLYGADLALQARAAGSAAVVLDALPFHNSLCPPRLPGAFWSSARTLGAKWPGAFPLATPCALLAFNPA